VPAALKLAGAALFLFVAGAVALNAHDSGSTTAAQMSPAATGRATTTHAATTPKKQTPTVRITTAPGPGQPAIADRAAAARDLARTYDNSAAQITKRANGAKLSATDARIVGALQHTGRAYRAAAAAATRNDVAAYTAALADAAQGRKQVTNALNASLQGSGTSTAPTRTSSQTPAPPPAPAPVSPCAGDSSSDDPSDDACGGP
jgi:hypothetical protein